MQDCAAASKAEFGRAVGVDDFGVDDFGVDGVDGVTGLTGRRWAASIGRLCTSGCSDEPVLAPSGADDWGALAVPAGTAVLTGATAGAMEKGSAAAPG